MRHRLYIASLLLCLAAISPFGMKAQEQADSVSPDKALSAIFASYMLEDVDLTPEAMPAFVAGLNAALQNDKPMEYYFGMVNGLNFLRRIETMRAMGLPVEKEKVFEWLTQMMNSGSTDGLTLEQANGVINNYFEKNVVMIADTVSLESQNRFLAEMAARKGSSVLPSGIIIFQESPGTSERRPQPGDNVMVAYEGRLSDGTVFDKTEEPIAMQVGTLVPGFNEGLLAMTEGSTIRLIIPASLGYGERGVPGAIPGNAALDFTVTLTEIK